MAPLTPYFFQLSFAISESGLQFWTLLSQHHLCALHIHLFLNFPEPCRYMRLATFSLHFVSFAVASVLQTILFVVCLPQ